MLFLGWLVVCFFVVGAINLYLRYFGLPIKRSSVVVGKNTYGSITFSSSGASIGGRLHGAAFSGTVGGESVHWINSVLSWIYQTQNRVPDFVESWLSALTTEAEKQSKDMQVRFEGIHGSPPEFFNFRTDSTSTEKDFTILTTLTLRDVTLQTSTLAKSINTAATLRIKCDIYLENLTGQVKGVAKFANNELILQLEFVSEPTIKLQIRPTRIDYTINNSAFDKVIRAAISRATMRVDWPSRSAGRSSHLSFMEPNSIEAAPVQRFSSDHSVLKDMSRATPSNEASMPTTFRDHTFRDVSHAESTYATPSPNLVQEHQPSLTQNRQTGDVQGQQPQAIQVKRQYSETVPGQQYPTTGQIQQYPGTVQGQQYSVTGQGQPYLSLELGQQPVIIENQQSDAQSEVLSQGPKLFIKVVKANGLIDNDFGNCSAYCRVHVDAPPQDFETNVIRNTVNPHWDEQFISDFDRGSKQVQFEVLDRDRQPGSDLLGKAVVLIDEIRRMPSSRQIIPLTGKPKSRTSTSGSVTIEFVFKDDISPATSSSSSPGVPLGFGQGTAGQKQSPGVSFSSSAQNTPPANGSSPAKEPLVRKDEKTPKTAVADYSPFTRRSISTTSASTGGPSQLSAHNLALTSSQPGAKLQESPTVVVTGVDSYKSSTLQPSQITSGTLDGSNIPEAKKKESFASTLKRKFGRAKVKSRSQSADRVTSHSLREGSYLKPPVHAGAMHPTPSAPQQQQQPKKNAVASDSSPASTTTTDGDETLRKARSNSFSSSLRRIFRRNKRDISRESSLTKPSSLTSFGRGDDSRETLTASDQGYNRSRRENTPVPSGDRFATGGGSEFPYSSSVPSNTSPLQSR